MRTLDDARQAPPGHQLRRAQLTPSPCSERWKTIFENHDSSAALKQATARQEPIDDSEAGSTTPCDTGLRSVCWRVRAALCL